MVLCLCLCEDTVRAKPQRGLSTAERDSLPAATREIAPRPKFLNPLLPSRLLPTQHEPLPTRPLTTLDERERDQAATPVTDITVAKYAPEQLVGRTPEDHPPRLRHPRVPLVRWTLLPQSDRPQAYRPPRTRATRGRRPGADQGVGQDKRRDGEADSG